MMDTRTFRLEDLDELLAWQQAILPILDSRVEPILITTRLDTPLDEGVERPGGPSCSCTQRRRVNPKPRSCRCWRISIPARSGPSVMSGL
jgi:hypothetical protein